MEDTPTYNPAPAAQKPGLLRSQEPKYTTDARGRIVNRHTGAPVPDEEPVFILRGKDAAALRTLAFYRDQLPAESRHSVDERILAFSAFAESYPERMRLPDTKPPIPPEPTSINARVSEPH